MENLSMSERLPKSLNEGTCDSINAFQVLGVPPLFDLDLRDIDRAYFDRQSENHPDRYAGTTPFSANTIEMISARINRSYQIVKNPVLRAAELMKMSHIPLPEKTQDLELLEEVMALQEEMLQIQEAQKEAPKENKTGKTWKNTYSLFFTKWNEAKELFNTAWASKDSKAIQTAYLRLTYFDKLKISAQASQKHFIY